MTATATRKRTPASRARRKATPPAGPMPWWGDRGPAPHLRYPGVTIEIPAVWVPLGKVRRVAGDDDEPDQVWTVSKPSRLVPDWELEAGGRWQSPDGVYFFDAGRAEHACAFFPELLRHHIGEFAGQPFELLEYQRILLTRPIFGWKSTTTGLRRFRKVFAFIPKGAGKSPWAAGTGLYLTVADGEEGAEVYALATDRDQARIVHTNAKVMVEQSEELSEVLDITKDSIVYERRRSVYKVLAADAGGAHGFRPHGAIFDEFHGQPNRDLYEAIKKSMVKRRQPLLLIVTHAGDDDEGICYEEYEAAKRVLSGTIDEPSFLPVIFEASPDDDWTDPAVWRRVNPGHGITVKTEGIALECKEAQNEPRKLNDFLRFHLNRWVNSAIAWIPTDWWDGCKEPVADDAALQLLPCAGGLDMAQKVDLAAFVLMFRHALERKADGGEAALGKADGDGGTVEVVGAEAQPVRRSLNYRVTILPFFWIPEDTMVEHEREDGVPYSQWAKAGLVFATEGNVIDYDRIVEDITTKILPRFPRLKGIEIGYDPAFATDVAQRLQNRKGFNMVEVLQNYKHLSEPSYLFEGLIKARRVAHGGHRVLRHHVENVLVKRDDARRIKPVKARNTKKRIDGVVASIMALSRLSALPDQPKRSGWSSRGGVIVDAGGARNAITGQGLE